MEPIKPSKEVRHGTKPPTKSPRPAPLPVIEKVVTGSKTAIDFGEPKGCFIVVNKEWLND